jgi:hypothetical protein
VQVIAAYLYLEGDKPFHKQGLRRIVKAPDHRLCVAGRLQRCQSLKYSPCRLLRWCVWPLVNVNKVGGNVWPDDQSKSLQQTIVTAATGYSVPHIALNAPRLNAADHGQADTGDKYRPASDPVKGVTLIAVIALKVEGTRSLLPLLVQAG